VLFVTKLEKILYETRSKMAIFLHTTCLVQKDAHFATRYINSYFLMIELNHFHKVAKLLNRTCEIEFLTKC
jgi:hypothetical protein